MDRFETERLILRRFKPSDLEAFVRMNADPRVMEYFPALRSREQTAQAIESINASFEKHGFGWWACELKSTGAFMGFNGLAIPSFDAPFMPAVENGWRLAYEFWGKGYATEGAKKILEVAFGHFKLQEIVSFTAVHNQRSRHVMEKIGMKHDPAGDFDHPKVPDGHPVKRHVLYRVRA